jgi:UDP-N-acetylmuramate dehydrogenase
MLKHVDAFKHWTATQQLQHGVSLKSLNTWHIGGTAEYFFRPTGVEDLSHFLACWAEHTENKPVHFLGLGSNLLIPDAGVEGVVVATPKGLTALKQLSDGLIYAEAGVPCAKLAKFCVKLGLNGGFFAGIPGTVGGALVMNAGAFGGETWQHVVRVDQISVTGQLCYRERQDCQPTYRKVSGLLPGWITGGYFKFEAMESKDAQQTIKNLLAKRQQTQPIGTFNCGSVFMNPPNQYAAQLIEAAGLKGKQVGGAMVSPKHANFIINVDNASAEDVLNLVALIQATVQTQTGILLQPEFKVW